MKSASLSDGPMPPAPLAAWQPTQLNWMKYFMPRTAESGSSAYGIGDIDRRLDGVRKEIDHRHVDEARGRAFGEIDAGRGGLAGLRRRGIRLHGGRHLRLIGRRLRVAGNVAGEHHQERGESGTGRGDDGNAAGERGMSRGSLIHDRPHLLSETFGCRAAAGRWPRPIRGTW